MSSNNNKGILDALDAYTDRINFYKKINQKQFVIELEIIYIRQFLSYYDKVKNSNDNQEQFIKEMITRLRKVILGILKNNYFTIKERAVYLVFCINPSIYEKYLIIKNRRRGNGK